MYSEEKRTARVHRFDCESQNGMKNWRHPKKHAFQFQVAATVASRASLFFESAWQVPADERMEGKFDATFPSIAKVEKALPIESEWGDVRPHSRASRSLHQKCFLENSESMAVL